MNIKQMLWFEAQFDKQLATQDGNGFQDLFSDLMEAAHPGDFERIRPRGSRGDGKCDGRLVNSGTIFQCYAPRGADERKLIDKIDADLAGAVTSWPGFIKEWVFVHNDVQGIGVLTAKHLDTKRAAAPGIVIRPWGRSRLLKTLRGLRPEDASSILGTEGVREGEIFLGYADLQAILNALATAQPPTTTTDMCPPPADKLERNRLSPVIRDYIRHGQQASDLVSAFLVSATDPELGERIAVNVKRRYSDVKAMELDPDEIFDRLEWFVGGTENHGRRHRLAVHAVLAYFFERCDIFERTSDSDGVAT